VDWLGSDFFPAAPMKCVYSTHACLRTISYQHKKRMNAWALYIIIAKGYASESTRVTTQENDPSHSIENSLLVA
jgi:hypothetical protein